MDLFTRGKQGLKNKNWCIAYNVLWYAQTENCSLFLIHAVITIWKLNVLNILLPAATVDRLSAGICLSDCQLENQEKWDTANGH